VGTKTLPRRRSLTTRTTRRRRSPVTSSTTPSTGSSEKESWTRARPASGKTRSPKRSLYPAPRNEQRRELPGASLPGRGGRHEPGGHGGCLAAHHESPAVAPSRIPGHDLARSVRGGRATGNGPAGPSRARLHRRDLVRRPRHRPRLRVTYSHLLEPLYFFIIVCAFVVAVAILAEFPLYLVKN